MTEYFYEVYEGLTEELYYTFTDALRTCEEDDISMRYRTGSTYGHGSTVGRIIIGGDEYDQFSYAYRIKFQDEDDSIPDKVFWYSDDAGSERASVLMAEQTLIDRFVNFLNKEEYISDDQMLKIQELFEELEIARTQGQSRYSIRDVANLIEDADLDSLQNFISSESHSDVELWKLLFSRTKDGDVIENNPTVEYIDEDMVFARAERQYHSGDEHNEYPFGILIQRTEDQDGRFHIHRMRRNKMLDDRAHEWDKEDVMSSLGADIDWPDLTQNSIPSEHSIRLTPNYIIDPLPYQSVRRSHMNNIYKAIQRCLESLYGNFYLDELQADLSNQAVVQTNRITVQSDATTQEIKNIQDQLNIEEEKVRKVQNRRGIGRLSSGLRGEIVTDIFRANFCGWLVGQSQHQIQKYDDELSYVPVTRPFRTPEENVMLMDAFPNRNFDYRGLYQVGKNVTDLRFENNGSLQFGNSPTDIEVSGCSGYKSISDIVDVEYSTYIGGFIVSDDAVLKVTRGTNRERYTVPKGVYKIRRPKCPLI